MAIRVSALLSPLYRKQDYSQEIMKTPVATLIIALLFLNLLNAKSQGFGGMGGDSDRIEGKVKFLPIPYADYDRSSGFTVGALPILMFNPSQKDTISPSSATGLLVSYSENKSWFAMTFGMLYLQEDNWRISYAAGLGDFNFQFFANSPINQWIKYQTNVDFVYAGFERKIKSNLYGGMSYIYTSFKNTSEVSNDSLPARLHGIGYSATWDARSNVSYPRSGFQVEADLTTYPSFMGNNSLSNQLELSYNHYISMPNKKDVLATRLFTGIGIGDVNFNQQFIVDDTDLRGYSMGQYRGNYLVAAQTEYRWNFHKRIGAVGFAGIASVFGSNNADDNGKLLPSIGCGFRYTYMKDTHSNIGFDVAKGKGDWSFNIRISEAF